MSTIPQGGRRRWRPSRARALSERTARPPIRTRGQPLVSSLAADNNVNDAPTPCPGRGGPAGLVTSREQRESVATYVLLRSGEHERVNERNPSKASAKAPAFIYSGMILLYQLQKMRSYVYPRVDMRELVRAFNASLPESTIYYA